MPGAVEETGDRDLSGTLVTRAVIVEVREVRIERRLEREVSSSSRAVGGEGQLGGGFSPSIQLAFMKPIGHLLCIEAERAAASGSVFAGFTGECERASIWIVTLFRPGSFPGTQSRRRMLDPLYSRGPDLP